MMHDVSGMPRDHKVKHYAKSLLRVTGGVPVIDASRQVDLDTPMA
jgi:hypothetical protein